MDISGFPGATPVKRRILPSPSPIIDKVNATATSYSEDLLAPLPQTRWRRTVWSMTLHRKDPPSAPRGGEPSFAKVRARSLRGLQGTLSHQGVWGYGLSTSVH